MKVNLVKEFVQFGTDDLGSVSIVGVLQLVVVSVITSGSRTVSFGISC